MGINCILERKSMIFSKKNLTNYKIEIKGKDSGKKVAPNKLSNPNSIIKGKSLEMKKPLEKDKFEPSGSVPKNNLDQNRATSQLIFTGGWQSFGVSKKSKISAAQKKEKLFLGKELQKCKKILQGLREDNPKDKEVKKIVQQRIREVERTLENSDKKAILKGAKVPLPFNKVEYPCPSFIEATNGSQKLEEFIESLSTLTNVQNSQYIAYGNAVVAFDKEKFTVDDVYQMWAILGLAQSSVNLCSDIFKITNDFLKSQKFREYLKKIESKFNPPDQQEKNSFLKYMRALEPSQRYLNENGTLNYRGAYNRYKFLDQGLQKRSFPEELVPFYTKERGTLEPIIAFRDLEKSNGFKNAGKNILKRTADIITMGGYATFLQYSYMTAVPVLGAAYVAGFATQATNTAIDNGKAGAERSVAKRQYQIINQARRVLLGDQDRYHQIIKNIVNGKEPKNGIWLEEGNPNYQKQLINGFLNKLFSDCAEEVKGLQKYGCEVEEADVLEMVDEILGQMAEKEAKADVKKRWSLKSFFDVEKIQRRRDKRIITANFIAKDFAKLIKEAEKAEMLDVLCFVSDKDFKRNFVGDFLDENKVGWEHERVGFLRQAFLGYVELISAAGMGSAQKISRELIRNYKSYVDREAIAGGKVDYSKEKQNLFDGFQISLDERYLKK